MFTSFSDVKEYIKKEKIEILDQTSAFSYRLLEEGVGFDGSSVGYKKPHSSDMALLIPDLSTGNILFYLRIN
jgi:glutamine synthetase